MSQSRVIIEGIDPNIDGGKYPAKRTVGSAFRVEADLVSDGHDKLAGCLKIKHKSAKTWQEIPLQFIMNDRWYAEVTVEKQGFYSYTVQAWIDHAQTWQYGLRKKFDAGQNLQVELLDGLPMLERIVKQAKGKSKKFVADLIKLINSDAAYNEAVELACSEELESIIATYPLKDFATTYEQELSLWVDRQRAGFSSWYELFPRSTSPDPKRTGKLTDVVSQLPRIANMGFDVLYLPPIHPIGEANRKGKNNSVTAKQGEPGSPWAIGSKHGGHKSISPALGTLKDFDKLVKACNKAGIELAMDFALQCAPDHPYVKEHPQWFKWKSDGTVQYAENPPKKYQDILPINFETEDWQNLWDELLSIVFFWAERGIRIFRVDNPHTKPFSFWQWLIAETQKKYPDFLFLSEAFTRPKIMHLLGKVGFSQSYTYYTWRNNKAELIEYMTELSKGPGRHYFRPNFWPNTPDINPYILQGGNENLFLSRYFMAATLSSNYGMYGPVYEFMEHEAMPGKEEYLNSEKYEARHWDWEKTNKLTQLITNVNSIRKANPALQHTENIHICPIENEHLFAYFKYDIAKNNYLLCVINLDAYNTQIGWVQVPMHLLPKGTEKMVVEDLITGNSYNWESEWNYVELRPELPFHLFTFHL
jgi:starch synthase (maltosyl-transferring)